MGQLFSLDATRELGGHAVPMFAVSGERPSRNFDSLPRVNAPEAPMLVEFFGLTESEQIAALNAFPGGKRFILTRTGETAAH